eukprot:CAMPEP_0176120142 /NCGR_PEP_ID=MMETSP0120_2-20121206/60427_1 /TAXON_ID=160619 /ORGANISM="Kryptoperidinium foliaceum, Strain CCMP 1326" /LENGTH=34 /DNA_ID= /DNA_START= /DNA_END= /DNA_ORIENTATION=
MDRVTHTVAADATPLSDGSERQLPGCMSGMPCEG